jgi:undecaprenyl-diphosphatase
MVDRNILYWLQVHHTAVLDHWMPGVAAVTGAGAWVVAAALVAILLVLRRRHAEAIWLFGGACIGSSLAALIKPLAHRTRPTPTLHDWSFPSGHATSSIVFISLLAFLINRRHPGHAKLLWGKVIGLILFIGFNRLYLGVHWPTDVLGGWLIGGGFAYFWCRLYPLTSR